MTGPPYPRPPKPGSNAIGKFIIGVSPIGTISPFYFWDTVISQYANSPTIDALLESNAAALDQTQNFDNFYDFEWNVLTAHGYGLDVWGRIVGVSRTVQPYIPGNYIGWQESYDVGLDPDDVAAVGWGQAPWYSGQALLGNFQVADNVFLLMILAKAAANITNGSAESINSIMMDLFPNRGNAYVTDNGDMSMTYTFNFTLDSVDLAIIGLSGILPKSSGVSATYSYLR